MNADRLISMIIRMFVRKAVNRGVNAGVKRMAGGGKSQKDMSPEERAQAKAARDNTQRARKALRVGRRIGKM